MSTSRVKLNQRPPCCGWICFFYWHPIWKMSHTHKKVTSNKFTLNSSRVHLNKNHLFFININIIIIIIIILSRESPPCRFQNCSAKTPVCGGTGWWGQQNNGWTGWERGEGGSGTCTGSHSCSFSMLMQTEGMTNEGRQTERTWDWIVFKSCFVLVWPTWDWAGRKITIWVDCWGGGQLPAHWSGCWTGNQDKPIADWYRGGGWLYTCLHVCLYRTCACIDLCVRVFVCIHMHISVSV